MRVIVLAAALVAIGVVPITVARAQTQTQTQTQTHTKTKITFEEALAAADKGSPDVAIVRGRERAMEPLVRMAGLYPNPQLVLGSASDSAVFSGGIQFPLVILGQIGASVDAAKANAATAHRDSDVAVNDARLSIARAYAALWLASEFATTRRDAGAIATSLERIVTARVDTGSAPEIDSLRVKSERLRTEADMALADAQTIAAAVELGRLMGVGDGTALEPANDPYVPRSVPPIESFVARIDTSPSIEREEADTRAAEARASMERALARPNMQLFLQAGARMPNDAANANPPYPAIFRLVFQIDLPIFNVRGANVDRELALADAARVRKSAAKTQRLAQLRAAYVLFDAATARVKILSQGVLPTAESAADAAQGAYSLGRNTLIAVLDAQRALIDARAQLLAARADRSVAWASVMHAAGTWP